MKRVLRKAAGNTLIAIIAGGIWGGSWLALGDWWALPAIVVAVVVALLTVKGLGYLISFLLRDN